jgi:hypothetical protein
MILVITNSVNLWSFDEYALLAHGPFEKHSTVSWFLHGLLL